MIPHSHQYEGIGSPLGMTVPTAFRWHLVVETGKTKHLCYKMVVNLSKFGLDDHEHESHIFEIWCSGDSVGAVDTFSCSCNWRTHQFPFSESGGLFKIKQRVNFA